METTRAFIRLVFSFLVIPILLFITAGSITWLNAWIFSALFIATGLVSHAMAERKNPGIHSERMKSGKQDNVSGKDKILAPLMVFFMGFPVPIVAGLDHRFDWSFQFTVSVTLIGFIITMIGYVLSAWAFIVNANFSSYVRVQKNNNHTVCKSGPYGIIRHPGYSGSILGVLGLALALNSYWSLIPAAAGIIIAIIRTDNEDAYLRRELDGYTDYAETVKKKLIPGIF